jgi:hypothetical protein
MDAKSKAKAKVESFPRRAAITAALEPSLLPPLINLVCEFTPSVRFLQTVLSPLTDVPVTSLAPRPVVLCSGTVVRVPEALQ